MKILVCINEDKSSDVALKLAGKTAKMMDTAVTAFFVMEDVPKRHRSSMNLPAENLTDKTIKEEYTSPERVEEKVFKRASQILGNFGVNFDMKTSIGDPTPEILKEISGGDYHTVVVGTRRLKGWRRLFSRSVSSEVAKYSSIPVLIANKDSELKNILLYTGCNSTSPNKWPWEYMANLVKVFDADLRLISFLLRHETANISDLAIEKAKKIFKDTHGIKFEEKVKFGWPAEFEKLENMILEEANERDLVILASRTDSGKRRLFRKDISLKVKERAKTNVLMLKVPA